MTITCLPGEKARRRRPTNARENPGIKREYFERQLVPSFFRIRSLQRATCVPGSSQLTLVPADVPILARRDAPPLCQSEATLFHSGSRWYNVARDCFSSTSALLWIHFPSTSSKLRRRHLAAASLIAGNCLFTCEACKKKRFPLPDARAPIKRNRALIGSIDDRLLEARSRAFHDSIYPCASIP